MPRLGRYPSDIDRDEIWGGTGVVLLTMWSKWEALKHARMEVAGHVCAASASVLVFLGGSLPQMAAPEGC